MRKLVALAAAFLFFAAPLPAQDYYLFGSVDLEGQYTAVSSSLNQAVASMWGGNMAMLYGNAWAGGVRVSYASGQPRRVLEVENVEQNWATYSVAFQLRRRWWMASTKFTPVFSLIAGYGWINPGGDLTTVRGPQIGAELGGEYEISRSVLLLLGANISILNTGEMASPYGNIDGASLLGLFIGLQIR